MAVLEAESGAETSWEGYFNVARLGSDVTIQTPAGEGEGITIRSEDARMDFYGHDLTVEGNIKSIRGKLYIGGASLAGDGSTGSDRPADRGSLTVKGNLLQPEGAVVVDGGRLTVTGDYRIQSRNSDGTYRAANGVLAMHDDDDYVKVEGDFYTGADPDYVNKDGDRITETFTAGTLEIGGNFSQTETGELAFRAGGTHKTVLTGTGVQVIQFANTNENSRFQTLDLSQDLPRYIFSRVPCWAELTQNGVPVTEEAIAAIPYTATLNADGDTLTITSWKDTSAQITIPDQLAGYTVTGIGNEVFNNRKNLEKITLPPHLKEIGDYAFRGCSALTRIDLPASLTTIGSTAFGGCQSLTAVTFAEGSALETISNLAFNACSALQRVDLPASVTTIGNNAFSECRSLMAVTFEEGSALKTIANHAFYNDRLLAAIEIPQGTTTIGGSVFAGCSALKKVFVPASVKEIGSYTFQGTGLTSAGPAGSGADYEFGWTTSIPAYAFDRITTLTQVTLPGSLRTLGRNAFAECQNLPAVTLPSTLETMGAEVFSGCGKLEGIEIPEGVESIPESAFRHCQSMTEATLPSTLKQIGRNAFEDCPALETITIPEGVKELPDRCFISCASLAEVTLPSTLKKIGAWAFENCFSLTVLEIPDGTGEIGQLAFKNATALAQLIVPDSVTSFHEQAVLETNSGDLVMYVVPGSAAEQYAIDHNIPYQNMNALGKTVRVLVKDPAGDAVTSGFSAYWYKADTEEYLGTGTVLRNVQAGTKLACSVILDEDSGSRYAQPEDALYEMGTEDHTIEITLAAFEKAVIRGTVKDAAGAAISGASVELRQTYNGAFDKTTEKTTGGNGAFTFNADRTRSVLTFSADGYYDSTRTLQAEEISGGTAVVDAVLEKIPEDRITMTIARQNAVLEGETPSLTEITGADLPAFTVYNQTKKKDITDFRVQFPYLIIGEGAASAGDTLRFSLADSGSTVTAENATLTLDENRCGTLEWLLVQNGSIRLTGVTSNAAAPDGTNPGVTVMIFDAQGKNVSSGSLTASYTTAPLPAGNYTCVLMEKTSMLRGADSYAKLTDQLGLKAGTDFASADVRVRNGMITVRDGITVPDFDESKLYYTTADNTRFWANYATAATAQIVTLRASYEIDKQHTTTGQTLSFEIPEGLEFVETSLTVDGRPASCSTSDTADGGVSVTVPVGKAAGTVRFYVLPTSAGIKKTYAYLSFKKGGDNITQPIGFVSVDVKAASITAPARTGFKKVAVSGKTAGDSEITLYDNGTEVGTTTANKNGSWSLEFDLVRPRKYSYHEIYADIHNSTYGDIETDKAGILYNANFVQVSKVTMINTAHPAGRLQPTEYRTVFDFLKPQTAVPSYNYWPSYPVFTFQVEFTGECREEVSDVRVITTNAAGERTSVACSYDEASGTWIGTHSYKAFADVPCRVGVRCTNASGDEIDDSMDLDDMTDLLTKAGTVDDTISAAMGDFADLAGETLGENRVTFDLIGDEEKLGEYSIELLDYADFSLDAWKKDRYVEYKYSDGTTSYEAAWLTDETYTIYSAYPEDQTYVKEVFRLTPGASAQGTAARGAGGFRASRASSAVYDPAKRSMTLEDWPQAISKSKKLKDQGGNILKDISGIQDAVDLSNDFYNVSANESTLFNALGEYKNAIMRKNCKCITRDMKDGYWRDAEDIEKQINDYVRHANILLGGTYAAGLVMDYCGGKVVKLGGRIAKAGGKRIYKAAMKRYGGKVSRNVRRAVFRGAVVISDEIGGYIEEKMGKLTKNIMGFFDVKGVVQDGFVSLRDYIRASIKNLTLYKCPCERGGGTCECEMDTDAPEEEPEEEPDEHGGGPDGGIGFRTVTPIADPSGYVYEAVPSNRVEGVTATVYEYKEIIETDDYGVETGRRKEEVKWDAENYDQVNPQTTDAAGIFAWDVPEGLWVVRFTKEGYEDADSHGDIAATETGENGRHYLPVPPIQTEINTAIVSKAAPAVESVSAYEDRVVIDFTQYIQIDTVNPSNVTVTIGGRAVTGTLEPLNAENNYEGTAQYASSFAFKPAASAGSLSGTAKVDVKKAKNYCGTAMADAYSGQHKVTVMPQSLEVTGAEAIPHHETGQMTIQILPREAGAGRTLTVSSYSPSIVSAQTQTLTADADGKAVVTLEGKLPGTGIVSITLEGTNLEKEKQVRVGEEPAQPLSLEEGDYTVTLSPSSFTYNGKAQKPAVTIEGLTEGADFTVTYDSDLTGAGTWKVTVTGTGNYTGSITKQYTVNKAAQAITAKASASTVTEGKTVTVKASGARETTAYSFSSSNAAIAAVSAGGVVTGKKPGTVTITVTTPQTANYKAGKATVKVTVKALTVKKPAKCYFHKWSNTKYDKCVVRWDKSAGASGYEGLLSWTDGSHAVRRTVKSNVLEMTFSVASNHVSQFKVRAFVDTAAGRRYSQWSNVTYITPSPSKFTCKKETTSAGLRANISWNIIYGCNGYNVFVTTNPNGAWYWNQSTSTKAGATSAVITQYRGSKLKKGQKYYVRIVTRRKRNGVFCTVPMPSRSTSIGNFTF